MGTDNLWRWSKSSMSPYLRSGAASRAGYIQDGRITDRDRQRRGWRKEQDRRQGGGWCLRAVRLDPGEGGVTIVELAFELGVIGGFEQRAHGGSRRESELD